MAILGQVGFIQREVQDFCMKGSSGCVNDALKAEENAAPDKRR